MLLALILVLLISGCGGYTEQEDYGWVEKPKRAVMERWNVKSKLFDTLWNRAYHFTGDRLDSIVDIRDRARTVFSEFSHALTNQRVVPWDFSLCAVFHTQYAADGNGGWVLAGTRDDSVHNGRVVSTVLKEIDSLGNWYVYHRTWEEFDTAGFQTANLTLSSNNIVYGDRYVYERGEDGRLMRMTKIELNDTMAFKIFARTDTERVTRYNYDRSGNLIEVIDSGGLDGEYPDPSVARMWDFVLHDSIALFSVEAIPNMFAVWPHMKYMKRGMYSLEMRGETNETQVTSELDNRFRLTYLKSSTSESQASYYDDNTIREKWMTYDGKPFGHTRTIRSYDNQKRVVLQETQEQDAGDEEFVTTSRVYFFY